MSPPEMPGRIRVHVGGIVGSAAPHTTKIGIFVEHGYKGTFFGFVTGLQAEAKTALLDTQLRSFVEPLGISELRVQPMGRPVVDPASQWEATMPLYISAAADTKEALQKLHAAFMGLGLSSYPGWYTDGSSSIGARTEYIPGLMLQSDLTQTVHHHDGTTTVAPRVDGLPYEGQPRHDVSTVPAPTPGPDDVSLPLGAVVYARSSDKGANSDLGVWVHDPHAAQWLTGFLTIDKLRELLDEPESVIIERYELPNLNGLTFVLRGHLGTSGASNLDADTLSKALSEFLRAKIVAVPAEIAAAATNLGETR